MRFDNRLATAMSWPARSPRGVTVKWRQFVDLLAQRAGENRPELLREVFAFVRANRAEVPSETRRRIAEALSGRRVWPGLLILFAEDDPAIAEPLLTRAILTSEEWLQILPSLGPTARAIVRQRSDLDQSIAEAIARLDPHSSLVALPSPAPSPSMNVEDASPGPAEPADPSDIASKEAFQEQERAGTAEEPHDMAAAHPAQEEPEDDQGRLFSDLPERSPAEAAASALHSGEAQIRDLVARIDAFQKSRTLPTAPEMDVREVHAFDWETGPDGTLIWIDGAPRGPLIGQTIAAVDPEGRSGVDGQAAGAFAKRSPFRDARFTIAGSGPAAGEWRISGVPSFDAQTGSFIGYRGSARRPHAGEVARITDRSEDVPGLFGSEVPADSLRQLIHELRTPLNAIVGFAEMIGGQHIGPAASQYRHRASTIVEDARRLLAAVDDLDTAARIETSRLQLGTQSADAAKLLVRIKEEYERVARDRQARVSMQVKPDLPFLRVDGEAVERMFSRLLAATVGLAREGETISLSLGQGQFGPRAMLCLSIARPRSISGIEERELLDPGYSPEGDWPDAPALGLGFSLRLVRNLAEAAGGALVIADDRFSLYLPSVEEVERSSERGG